MNEDRSPKNINDFRTVLVTGGAGYVGSALVPHLLRLGYSVKVVDTFWYGRDVFDAVKDNPLLQLVELDIRDTGRLRDHLRGMDAVIHLACISNDPSFELDPKLGKSINYDAFAGLFEGSLAGGVRRFIYASSSSIYGVKDVPDVREDAEPSPLTDYSRFKHACERQMMEWKNVGEMQRVIIRPATVCGYSARLRLDLTVNILTIHALVNRKIRIFGGKQLRPNLNIVDMVAAYELLLNAPGDAIDGEAFNVGYQNLSVETIAVLVRDTLDDPTIELTYEHSDDNRSYHVNSDKIRKALGFSARHTVEDAILSILSAYREEKLVNPMTNPLYYNIKRMQSLRGPP